MKRFILIIGLCSLSLGGFSQGNLRPLIERIALLQVYLAHLKKGYDIAKGGLKTIKDITQGEFDLHATFFRSLKSVNPVVKQYAKVGLILSTQLKMVKAYQEAYHYARRCEQFTSAELNYLSNTFQRLMEETAKDIELLTTVLSNDKLEMKDNERIACIDQQYDAVMDKAHFLTTFNVELHSLAQDRQQTRAEIDLLLQIHHP